MCVCVCVWSDPRATTARAYGVNIAMRDLIERRILFQCCFWCDAATRWLVPGISRASQRATCRVRGRSAVMQGSWFTQPSGRGHAPQRHVLICRLLLNMLNALPWTWIMGSHQQ